MSRLLHCTLEARSSITSTGEPGIPCLGLHKKVDYKISVSANCQLNDDHGYCTVILFNRIEGGKPLRMRRASVATICAILL